MQTIENVSANKIVADLILHVGKASVSDTAKDVILFHNFPLKKLHKYILHNRFEKFENGEIRKAISYKEDAFLLEEIKNNGLERRVEAFLHEGEVIVYDGHRRIWACLRLGKTTITLALHTKMTLAEASTLAVARNRPDSDRSRRYLNVAQESVGIAKSVACYNGNFNAALRADILKSNPGISLKELEEKQKNMYSAYRGMALIGNAPMTQSLLRRDRIRLKCAYLLADLETTFPAQAPDFFKKISDIGKFTDADAQALKSCLLAKKSYNSVFNRVLTGKSRKKSAVKYIKKSDLNGGYHTSVSYHGVFYVPGSSPSEAIKRAYVQYRRLVAAERQDYLKFKKAVHHVASTH